ncbi:hypothetical protein ACEQUB_03574 [Ralstonia syzygii]
MDIKRTILWVIFSLSVVLLFDNWQRANGHQSMFFPTPQTATTSAAAPGSTPAGDVPKSAAAPAAAGSQAAPATGAASQTPAAEKGRRHDGRDPRDGGYGRCHSHQA